MKKIISILLVINTLLFIVSFSISFTILFRPFYYFHISYLELEKNTNYTYKEIKEAYDDVLDYCVFNKPFKTGKLKYSEEGKNHFKDCRKLFIINFIVLGITLIIIIIKKLFYNKIKILGFNISFWSSSILLLILLLLLITTLIIGFDDMFIYFHKIFFINKDNWLFDSDIDEIILILPTEYFRNCGILIVSMISSISIINIIKEIIIKKKSISEVTI